MKQKPLTPSSPTASTAASKPATRKNTRASTAALPATTAATVGIVVFAVAAGMYLLYHSPSSPPSPHQRQHEQHQQHQQREAEHTTTTLLASANDSFAQPKWFPVPCWEEYTPAVVGCTPRSNQCGRLISDGLCSREEALRLRAFAERVMSLGGGAGGPTILDLHSGALSKGDRFVNVYAGLANPLDRRKLFPKDDIDLYVSVENRIRATLQSHFGLDRLYLTRPTFFSRIEANRPPKTINDEYWHVHVDKTTYGTFVYTSLLYLNDFGSDFEGGEFAFVSQPDGNPLLPDPQLEAEMFRTDNTTVSHVVQPRAGRVSAFTSGPENPHHVRRVTKGVRFALTIAFTCDEQRQSKIPLLGA